MRFVTHTENKGEGKANLPERDDGGSLLIGEVIADDGGHLVLGGAMANDDSGPWPTPHGVPSGLEVHNKNLG